MSSMKRQSSWQEDIARNFSRLFQRTKSQDPEKIEESDIISGQENGVNSSSHSIETSDGEPSLQQEDLQLFQAFQGTEEGGNGEEDGVLEETLEDGVNKGQERGGQGSCSVSCEAGQSSEEQPLVPPPSVGSLAGPLGPTAPTPPPPLDAFFRRLGSLFHFKAETARAAQQQEEQQQAQKGGGGQEEAALGVVVIQPDPSGMTCGADGDQDHCDFAGRLPGDKDTGNTETEDRRAEESDLHCESTSTHADQDTLEKPASGETHTDGHGGECGEGDPVADSGPLSDGESSVDEHQRRLALACPPVVTYGTFRGQWDRRRMRRRHQVKVDSPISEGDEPAVPKQSDIQTVSASQIGPSTSETNAVLGPTGRGSGHIPLTAPTAERAGSQSAFTLPREASLVTGGSQAKNTVSAVGSVIVPPPAPTEHSADARTNTAVSVTHGVQQNLPNRILTAETASEDTPRDTDTGLREQTETLSERCVQTGSPSTAAASRPSEPPGAGGAAQHTHRPAADSDGPGGQLAQQPISLPASPASASVSLGATPATRPSDPEEALESGPGDGPYCFASGEEGDSGPSDDPFEEALHLESKMLVDNILKNAVAALERIGSSEPEEDETIQKASVDIYLDLPMGHMEEEGSVEQSFKPDELVEMGPSESGEDRCPSAIPAEQTPTLNPKPLSEGPRSTPSSGYESIAGSDTDIRSSPGPACENGTPTSIVSDSCVEGTPYTGLQTQVKGQQLIIANDHLQGEGYSQSNDPVNSKYSGDKHQRDGLPCFSGIVSFQKPSLCGDSGDNIHRKRVSHEYECVSGKTKENKGNFLCISGDKGYIDVPDVKETQVGDRVLHVAKADIESNTHSLKEDCNVNFDHVSVYNNSNDTFNQHINLSDIASLRNFEPDLVRRDYKHKAKGNTEADFMSVRPKHIQNSLQPSQNRYTISPKPIACVTLHDEDQGSCPEITLKVCQSETSDPASLDQSFVLVKTYLASVVSEGSDSGGEETEAHCKPTENISLDPSKRLSKDLSTSEGLVFNSASGSSNEDRPQWSSVRAYRCDVSPQQSRETPGHSGAGAAAMAGFHQDLSSKLAGLHAAGATGGRRVPALEPLLPLLPVPQLAFHDMETSCFSIIDEEEETDAVFVNDTGPMLSPTARRAKAYPFSLSPIVEEDSFRGEETVEGGLSQEDMGLTVPPATEEELRSLSGGARTEQQASSTSLSVLSLLQSVSERLQSSGYSDADADSEETFGPPPQCPLWDFFNRGQAENKEVDGQGMDGDQISKEEGPGSLTLTTNPFCMGPWEGNPTVDSQFKNLSVPSEYQYFSSDNPVLPDPDDDNRKHAKPVPGLRDCKCPSTATDKRGGSYYGKVISRPMLMIIYDGVTFSGERREIHHDRMDYARVFPNGASVRVLRGCWLLYMETGFRGPGMLLEDGETVLGLQPGHQQGDKPTKITIGSIRRLVKDDSAPEISLHPIGAQGAMEHLVSEADNLGTHSRPIDLSNLTVKSGCWLAYESPGFHGSYVIMEADGSITPAASHQQVTAVRSLRPLRMSGLRVRRPLDPKMFVFELPLFHGQGRELGGHTPSLGAVPGLKAALSLRVIGGVWVGYTEEGYTGQQYLLEEGEYSDCAELSGAAHPVLRSFRFLHADFIEPSVLLQEESVSPGAGEIEILDVDIPDLEEAGATEKTSALLVKNGVWVAYSGRCFTGEQYILEKGKHPATLPWGNSHGPAKSIRPIRLDTRGTGEPNFLLRAFSLPHYRGISKDYEGEAGHCGIASPMSFRVIRGSWLLFDEEGCCGNQYILQEGHYPDLISCGCMATSVKSLKPIPYSFSDPSISLFSLGSFEGLMMVAVMPTEHTEGFFSQSLQVEGGLWVVYEYSNYKGRQMLLQPGEIPSWGEHSGWDTIGSLRPLKQPWLYVQVRSRALGTLLTSESVQDDSSPSRVSLSPPCSLDTQHWLFIGGLLRCKASKACLSVIGGKTAVGARVALWPEHGRTHQRWSLNHNGTISSHLNHKLVLDFRGGTGFGRDHLVINEFNTDQATQFWDIELV
ncbi:uncharacterized protein LOC105023987 isoform X1 [Esox lucius]|uniref:Beta/gamma crystallin 'Greek key' domain-containing protein n=1 Tax=Esox lucius TaxID=8010 RepID=A0A3P8YB49_ESOLU|nr:uncharacterized protein LOC105023987 isoform X1 [Esox lucius]